MDFKIIKKKYLKIDLGLMASAPAESAISEVTPLHLANSEKQKEDWRVTLKKIWNRLKTIEIKIPNLKKRK